MNVNCARINGGIGLQALSDLTGMPVLSNAIREMSKEDVYKAIKEASDQPSPWPMVVGTDNAI